jgi:pyruvate/2-oxoacid:ferredoxin oxidoreductase beta subunit
MFASGMDIKVIVLDTQVYSNTGGQTSTGSFKGQDAKMSFHGKVIDGKKENRKEIANIALMHKDVYVAQTTCSHINHFYKAIMEANEYPGPAIVNVPSRPASPSTAWPTTWRSTRRNLPRTPVPSRSSSTIRAKGSASRNA